MEPGSLRAAYSPEGSPRAPSGGKPGRGIPAVVAGCVLLTLCGSLGAIYVIAREARGPLGEIWLDNVSEDRLSVEVGGARHTLEPRSSGAGATVVKLPAGTHALRVLDASGTEREARTLSLARERRIYPVGGAAQYAVVVVRYALPETQVPPDSAKLLPVATDGAGWVLPWSADVAPFLDQPFPETSRQPVMRHVCRVAGDLPLCDGGPKKLTSAERYTGREPDE